MIKWSAIEKYTVPPYSMTLKSNGCIIFIGALTPTNLVVTSKNALGPTKEASNKPSHAQKGEEWLLRHLASKGRTTEVLARVLYEKNWTAVAEVCLIPWYLSVYILMYMYSYAMMTSRNTFYPLLLRKQAFIFMD